MTKVVDTFTHYEMLIDENNDPVHDSEILRLYMTNWDGPLFYKALELDEEKNVLEVGIGTGRVAKSVLDAGCKKLVGIDISPKTIQRAKENLKEYKNIDLLEMSILDFNKTSEPFDIVYSVLTFMHIEDKEKACKNIKELLKDSGYFILSISNDEEWLDYGQRKVRLYPKEVEYYINLLRNIGFQIDMVVQTECNYATIIKARK